LGNGHKRHRLEHFVSLFSNTIDSEALETIVENEKRKDTRIKESNSNSILFNFS